MENEQLLKEVTEKAKLWLGDGYDEETRKEVQRMLDADDKTELIECFYKDLEFGTGDLPIILRRRSRTFPRSAWLWVTTCVTTHANLLKL